MSDTENVPLPTTRDEVEEMLNDIREARGYLLPHHGLLAVTSPALLDAYDASYAAMTLKNRHLGEQAKEFVWLAILASTHTTVGTHHIGRWRDSGGSDEALEVALKLAAYAHGVAVFPFVQDNWAAHLPDQDAEGLYRDGIAGIVGGTAVSAGWIEIALAAVHMGHQRWWAYEVHVRGAYDAGVPEGELAEALTFAMFHCGAPHFVNACERWRRLILAGEVAATEPYRAWAELPGQGGYDEAAKS